MTLENPHEHAWALRRVTRQEKTTKATRETLPFVVDLPNERQRLLFSECVPEVRFLWECGMVAGGRYISGPKGAEVLYRKFDEFGFSVTEGTIVVLQLLFRAESYFVQMLVKVGHPNIIGCNTERFINL
jgi:hypothetical protein